MSGAPQGRWVLASGNPGKLFELRALLATLGLDLVSQTELGIVQPPETGRTFVENALTKAREAARQSGLAAIADESGLAVDALGGKPGIHSARFAGDAASDADNVALLLERMMAVPAAERTASFHCVLVALIHADDPAPVIAQGVWRGRISSAPRGAGGFGYDPVFIGEGMSHTAAELSPADKNRVSHRGQALNNLVAALTDSQRGSPGKS